jgi:hypothetical protein
MARADTEHVEVEFEVLKPGGMKKQQNLPRGGFLVSSHRFICWVKKRNFLLSPFSTGDLINGLEQSSPTFMRRFYIPICHQKSCLPLHLSTNFYRPAIEILAS